MRNHMEQTLRNNPLEGTVISEVSSWDHYYTDGASVGACFRVCFRVDFKAGYVYVYPDGSVSGYGPNVEIVKEWIAKYVSKTEETTTDSLCQSTLQDTQQVPQ